MDEVNRNPDLLPNSSLVFDFPGGGCKTVPQLYNLLHFSKENHDVHPNYKCAEENECILILSGPNWAISEMVGTLLNFFMFQTVRFFVLWVCKKLLLSCYNSLMLGIVIEGYYLES